MKRFLPLLSIWLLGFAGCAGGQRGETGKNNKGPACSSIEVPGIGGPATLSGSTCTPVANCNANNAGLKSALLLQKCKTLNDGKCAAGDCNLPQTCRSQYAAQHSAGITLAGAVSAPDPTCPAGEQRCTADIVIAAGGNLACNCACENP